MLYVLRQAMLYSTDGVLAPRTKFLPSGTVLSDFLACALGKAGAYATSGRLVLRA